MLSLPDGNGLTKSAYTIQELFGLGCTELVFDDYKAAWFSAFRGWPFSIDSLFVARTLRDEGYCTRALRTIADIGCGTGFLGGYLASKNSSIQHVIFSDIDGGALLNGMYNLEGREPKDDSKHGTAVLGVGIRGLLQHEVVTQILNSNDRITLGIVTPPYLPDTHFIPNVFAVKAVSGTSLLEDAVLNGHRVMDELVIQFATIAQREFDCAVAQNAAQIADISILAEMEVAFRLAPIYEYLWSRQERLLQHETARRAGMVDGPPTENEHKRWSDLENRGRAYLRTLISRGLVERHRFGYRYFLVLRCYRLVFKRSQDRQYG